MKLPRAMQKGREATAIRKQAQEMTTLKRQAKQEELGKEEPKRGEEKPGGYTVFVPLPTTMPSTVLYAM